MQIILRGRTTPAAQAFKTVDNPDPLAALKEVLTVTNCDQPEPIISWRGLDELVALDVDFTGDARKQADRVHDFLTNVSTSAPDARWRTHGDGLRLIFTKAGDFTAEERACVYVLRLMQAGFCSIDFRIEIKSDTRHPRYPRPGPDGQPQTCGEVREGSGFKLDQRSLIARLMGDWTDSTLTDEQIESFLAERGWQIGKRYDHEHCPIAPSSHGDRDPVSYLDGGIYCHVCNANGRAFPGVGRPGFVPWQKLIEDDGTGARLNPLREAIRGWCHWEHARHVVTSVTGCQDRTAEKVYRAMLKAVHVKPGMEAAERDAVLARIERAFFPPVPVAYTTADWVRTTDFKPVPNRGLEKQLQGLPSVKWTDGKGKVHANQQRLGALLSGGDQTEQGYPALKIVRGVDFDWAGPTSRHAVPIPTIAPARPPFRYYAADKRDMAWVAKHLAAAFPGVRLDVIRLLIAAKGVAQTDPHEPPRIYLKGQSGSAKSAHVTLAAELALDGVQSMRLTADLERSQRLLIEAARRGAYVFVDEVDKVFGGSSGFNKFSPEQVTQFVLSTNRGVLYHQLYVGLTEMVSVPVVCFAGCELPRIFVSDRQLARRVVLVDLEAGILTTGRDWRETGGEIVGWRTRDTENTRASDMLVSDVKDRHGGGLTFEQVASSLGFSAIDAERGDFDPEAAMREFFRIACETVDTDNARWRGKHWKAFSLDSDTPLAKAFKEAIDPAVHDCSSESARQPLVAAHWGRVLGRPDLPVVCEFDRHGRSVAVRFRRGKAFSRNTFFNDECLGDSGGEEAGKAMGAEPVTISGNL